MSQEELISSDTQRIRCIAGPGTGKSYSLKGKVKRLIETNVTEASKIFAVTYTRLAAGELKRDLTSMDVEGSEQIESSTLHSFAYKILQQENAISELGRHPRPCFSSEIKVLENDLAAEFSGVRNVQKKIKALSSMWARLQHESPGYPSDPDDCRFNTKYQEWMKFHKGIMIDELISLAVTYIRNNPVNDITNKFDYIIVDEYQDLNKADQTLINLISDGKCITILGDDDQSIYSFRHAHPTGIRTWLDEQPDPKEQIHINTCRRCDGKIISLSNSLIANNPNRLNNALIPMQGKEELGMIDIVQWPTRGQESKGIAMSIKKILENGEIPEDEGILVLVPRAFFGEKIKEELEALGINDVSLKTKMKWDGNYLGESIAYATLLKDNSDLIAIRYLLGLRHATWYREKYSILYNFCRSNSENPINILNNLAKCQELRITALNDRWNQIQEKLQELSSKNKEELIDILFPLSDDTERIGKILREMYESSDLDDKELIDVLTESVISMDDFSEDTKIKIMTLHGAKGLSSHTVIVAGVVNGILPSKDKNTNQYTNLDEDRRLFYVALTRAKNRLILSSFKKVTSIENSQKNLGLSGYSIWLNTSSSMFFTELGMDTPPVVLGDNWLNTL